MSREVNSDGARRPQIGHDVRDHQPSTSSPVPFQFVNDVLERGATVTVEALILHVQKASEVHGGWGRLLA